MGACTPKIKRWAKSFHDSAQFWTNLYFNGKDQHIDNRKMASSATIPPTFNDKLVNLGPVTKMVRDLMLTTGASKNCV